MLVETVALRGGPGAWPVTVRHGLIVENRKLLRATPLVVRAPHMRDGVDAYRLAWVARGEHGLILPLKRGVTYDPRKRKFLDQYIGDLGIDRGIIAPPYLWDEELYDGLWCATVTIITSGTTWAIPADWNNANNKIECVGGGGRSGAGSATTGGGGGGGAAYAVATNKTETGTVTIQVGVGTGIATPTYFNGSAVGAADCGANAGVPGSTTTHGAGGAATGGSGTQTAGGNGGDGGSAVGGGGGGGAAGPSGAGAVGTNGSATNGGDGGQGGNGSGGAGGTGATSTVAATAGNNGTDITSSGAGAGSGGGGGGGCPTTNTTGKNGGLYGSGAGGWFGVSTTGAGRAGVVVTTYTPPAVFAPYIVRQAVNRASMY